MVDQSKVGISPFELNDLFSSDNRGSDVNLSASAVKARDYAKTPIYKILLQDITASERKLVKIKHEVLALCRASKFSSEEVAVLHEECDCVLEQVMLTYDEIKNEENCSTCVKDRGSQRVKKITENVRPLKNSIIALPAMLVLNHLVVAIMTIRICLINPYSLMSLAVMRILLIKIC